MYLNIGIISITMVLVSLSASENNWFEWWTQNQGNIGFPRNVTNFDGTNATFLN